MGSLYRTNTNALAPPIRVCVFTLYSTVYKDAILNKRDLRIALTEIWGGLAPGTVHEIDEMMRSAKAGSDATNYAHSNAAYCFKTHWTRLLGIRMMAAIGRVLCNAAPLVKSPWGVARADPSSGPKPPRLPLAT